MPATTFSPSWCISSQAPIFSPFFLSHFPLISLLYLRYDSKFTAFAWWEDSPPPLLPSFGTHPAPLGFSIGQHRGPTVYREKTRDCELILCLIFSVGFDMESDFFEVIKWDLWEWRNFLPPHFLC